MVISVTTSQVTPEQAHQVEAFLQGFLPKVEQESGVVAIYHYYRPDPGQSTTLIVWETDEALLAYRQSAPIQEADAFERKLGLKNTRESNLLSYAVQR